MTDNANIVAYEAGKRLVAMEDRDVRTYVVMTDGEGVASVYDSFNNDEPSVLYTGTLDETRRVLDGVYASYAGQKAVASNHRQIFLSAVAVVLVTGAIGVAVGEYARKAPGYDVARIGAAPDRITSNNPTEDAFTAAGNDDKTGNVSSHGSTGATVAPSIGRPGGVSPTERAPTLGAIPQPPASALAGDASTVKRAGSDKPGIESRATDAAAKSKDDVEAAKEAVNKTGTSAAEKELATLKSALNNLGQNDKLPPEVVRTLPHDLAKQLQDAGVVESADETSARLSGNGPKRFNIIHLPPQVSDSYRDHDAVPTIPEENSWIATGGNVVIPLPGGGEIKKPSDLALFGLDG